MKLAVSNIAWPCELDGQVYELMREKGFTGLEIAPTRIFPDKPYKNTKAAGSFARALYEKYGFVIPSMQSIWYGRSENIFKSPEERSTLLEYTYKAVDFAAECGCKNLVFGCPKNRTVPKGQEAWDAGGFFKSIGDYAASKGCAIGMEANPPIYNTNYINTTGGALELIRKVGSPGFLLNLDTGTMIENGEDITVLSGSGALINHVHISEPYLAPLKKRQLHRELAKFLKSIDYKGFVSIEAGRQDDISALAQMMDYVGDIYYDI